ncbi:MAG: hypothetical protein HKN84_04895 [Gammaproteobacteria bacterium]|nr:hypothetical protein [Gammaproteobacteria bacterium]
MSHRILILVLTVLLPTAAGAQTQAPDEEFLRLARDETGAPASLQSPILSFEPVNGEPRGLRVDLVGAIHVGDASYYATLNDRFAGYDAVLYELVAPEGTRPLPNTAPGNLLSGLQQGITEILDLSYQLDEIDYTRTNLIHADLTPETLAQSMDERGESPWTYFSRLFTASLDEAALPMPTEDVPGLLEALFSPDRPRLLKTLIASSILDVEMFSRIVDGDSGSSLVADRNARAMTVLDDRLRAGDRRIAVFYGVAHLPDLAERLKAELGLRQYDSEWIDAWDLRADPSD